MLEIFPLKEENKTYYNIVDRRYLFGEITTVKITLRGFSLGYTPKPEAQWRKEEPTHFLPISEMIKGKDAVCYLAFQKKHCVGQVVCVENWNGRGAIWDIAVDLQERRRGIGTELLKACEAWAKNRNLYGLMIETTDSNPIACQFLEKNDYVLGGVDRLLYHSLIEESKKAPLFRDTGLQFYYDF